MQIHGKQKIGKTVKKSCRGMGRVPSPWNNKNPCFCLTQTRPWLKFTPERIKHALKSPAAKFRSGNIDEHQCWNQKQQCVAQ